MKIECAHDDVVDVTTLVPNPKNPNQHPDNQIKLLAKIMKHQGWRSPIVVSNRSGFIIKGHGRLAAAKLNSWTQAPIDRQDYASEADEYADMVADNKIAELSDTDLSMVNRDVMDLGPDFDLDLLGIPDFIIEPIEKLDPGCDEDEVPEHVEPKTKLGDLYQLGKHRLMCGDSTSIDAVEKLMGGEKADMVHTDPPYNVDYSNADRPKAGKTDLGRIENDSMPVEQFHDFLSLVYSNIWAVTKDNAAIYVWYASKMTVPFFSALEGTGIEINRQIIWKKPMLLGRGRYQWAHEPCIFAIKGSPYHTDDRTKTTVWDFGGYDKSKNVHPTQKPVVIPEEAIQNSTKAGNNVLDLFGGSGSTLIACEKTNRQCFMMELDPHYCDVILTRWEKYTGKKAGLVNG